MDFAKCISSVHLSLDEGSFLLKWICIFLKFLHPGKVLFLDFHKRKLFLSTELSHLCLGFTDTCDYRLSCSNGSKHIVFRDFMGSTLYHGDTIMGSCNYNVQISVRNLLECRVDYKFISNLCDPYSCNRSIEWNIRNGDGTGSCVDGHDVWSVDHIR